MTIQPITAQTAGRQNDENGGNRSGGCGIDYLQREKKVSKAFFCSEIIGLICPKTFKLSLYRYIDRELLDLVLYDRFCFVSSIYSCSE